MSLTWVGAETVVRARRAAWRVRVGFPIFLALLPFLFFWPETFGWRGLGDQDAVFWFYPAYQEVVSQVRSGGLPLWHPDWYSGVPLFALWQAGILDPLNWVHFLGSQGPTSRTLTLSLQLAFSLSLLATYGYGRSIGLSRRGATLAAIVYSMSGFAVARVLYPGLLHGLALTPLILLLVERIYKRGQRGQEGAGREVVLASMVVTWQVLAAHPQPLIYGGLLVGVYALIRGGIPGRSRTRFWSQVGMIYCLGAMGSAVQLLPAAEYAARSVRERWGFELFTLHSIHPATLLTTIIPFFHGVGKGEGVIRLPYWGVSWHHNETQIYLGVLALALAIGGAWYALQERDRIRCFWVGAAVGGMLLAMGKYIPPLAALLYQVPVLSQFRSPNRYWMVVALAVGLLAGSGFDRMWRNADARVALRTRWAALVLTGIILVVGGWVWLDREWLEATLRALPDWRELPDGFLGRARGAFLLPLVGGGVACLLLWGRLFRRGTKWRRDGSLLLLVCLLADYHLYALVAPIHHLPGMEHLLGRAVPSVLRREPRSQSRSLDRAHLLLSPRDGEFSPLLFAGTEMVTGYDPLLDQRYKSGTGIDEVGRHYLGSVLQTRDRTLDLLATRYVLVPPDWEPPPLPPLLPVEIPEAMRLWGELPPPLTIGEELLEVEGELPQGSRWEITLHCGEDLSSPVALPLEVAAARLPLPSEIRHCQEPLGVEVAHLRPGRADRYAADGPRLHLRQLALHNQLTGERREMSPLREVQPYSQEVLPRWQELPSRSGDPAYAHYRLLENRHLLPRFWLVTEALPAFEGDQLKLIRGDFARADGTPFDPRRTALVEMPLAGEATWYLPFLGTDPSAEGPGVVRLIHWEANRFELETQTEQPALLIVSERADPGWKVTVDGQAQSWHRVNYHLRGVVVPEGRHRVEYQYRPPALYWGVGISLVTFLLWLTILWSSRSRPGSFRLLPLFRFAGRNARSPRVREL